MGSIFELIADRALWAEEDTDECDICSKSGVPCYPCRGMLVRPDGTADIQTTVDAVCEACFKAGRVAHYGEYDLNLAIDDFAKDREAARRLLRETPRCQKITQVAQWPVCCGRLTEYTGKPTVAEAVELERSGSCWDGGPVETKARVSLLAGIPTEEFRGSLSAYRCLVCPKKYWIFQST